MINWFDTIKRYYDLGFYTKEQVHLFVDYKKITETQYNEIVGMPKE